MTKQDQLIQILTTMKTAGRVHRQACANTVLQDKTLFKHLVNVTFLVDNKASIKAAWVLEWLCTHHNLEWLAPHLDVFCNNIQQLKFDSAIRPCAKICEHIATVYHKNPAHPISKAINKNHIDLLITTGFNWLLTPQKIAVKAYTMNTLYLFGLYQSWIHPELKHIILSKIIKESKGTKARGEKIVVQIDKHSL